MRKLLLFILCVSPAAHAQSESVVQYLANEGVMVTFGETKVLFDPLFDNSYQRYQMVPEEMRDAILDGTAPYDDVDAVFVSHHHGDHFAAADVMTLLRNQAGVRLYAPAQAVAAMREISNSADEALFERVVGLELEYGDYPVRIEAENILVEAVHVPHSGWPTSRTDVQNIVFRVTLGDTSTIVHFGDADARLVHFDRDEEYWEAQRPDLALPPYWFFSSADGQQILDDRLNARFAIGIHVPAIFSDPDGVPKDLLEADLFTRPGERRTMSH